MGCRQSSKGPLVWSSLASVGLGHGDRESPSCRTPAYPSANPGIGSSSEKFHTRKQAHVCRPACFLGTAVRLSPYCRPAPHRASRVLAPPPGDRITLWDRTRV